MAFRHTIVGGVFTIAGVFGNIVRSYSSLAGKGVVKNSRIAGHAESFKGLSGSPGKGVKQERLAVLIKLVIKKCPKCGAGYLGGNIRNLQQKHQYIQVLRDHVVYR